MSAKKYKIKTYARVDTISGLKTALYQSGPCYIAFPVYDNRPEFWRKNDPDAERQGGHAVCVVGYNKTGFIIRNSWGKNWNGDGHVIYPYDEFGAHWSCYAVVDNLGSPKPGYKKLHEKIIHDSVEIEKIQGIELFKLVFTIGKIDYSSRVINIVKDIISKYH